jgi:hypothetical protein
MSKLTDCLRIAKVPADEAAEIRAEVKANGGDAIAGVKAYLEGLYDSAEDLRETLKKAGFDLSVKSLGGETKRKGPVTIEDVHAKADEKNIPWDDDRYFMERSKELTGKEKLDDMTPAELRKVYDDLDAVEARPDRKSYPPASMENRQGTFSVGKVNFGSGRLVKYSENDKFAQEAMGSVPDSGNIIYKGAVAWMTPETYLKLAADTHMIEPSDYMIREIEKGTPVGVPFLTVLMKDGVPTVVGHEGRHRVKSIMKVQPDMEIPVHIFGRGDIDRAKYITPEIAQKMMASLVSEKSSNTVSDPISKMWVGDKEHVKAGETKAPKLKGAGESLGDGRKKVDDFDDKLKDQTELEKRAELILEQTQRSATFTAKPEGASGGTLAYLDRVRSALRPFSELVSGVTGGGRSKWSLNLREAFIKSYATNRNDEFFTAYEERRADLEKRARKYIALLDQLEQLTKNATTIEEASSIIRNAFIENYDEAMADLDRVTNQGGELYNASEQTRRVFIINSIKLTDLGADFLVVAGMGQYELLQAVHKDNRGWDKEWTHGLVDEFEKNKRLTPVGVELKELKREDMPDRRGGKDVNAEDLVKTFGFRGVQFGNWVNDKEGRLSLNHAYDALMDLADVMGIKPENIAITKGGKKLGLAFGAFGKGGRAAALYFPGPNADYGVDEGHVINITKTKGTGTLAHEWGHALDYALRENANSTFYSQVVTDLKWALTRTYDVPRVRKMFDSLATGGRWIKGKKRKGAYETAKDYIDFKRWKQANWNLVGDTDYQAQGNALGKDYWGSSVELWARWFESMVYDLLPGSSPYLVNSWVRDSATTKMTGYRGSPYPTGEERRMFLSHFERMTKALKFEEDGSPYIDTSYKSIRDEIEVEIDTMLKGMLENFAGRKNQGKSGLQDDHYGKDGRPNVPNVARYLADKFVNPSFQYANISEARADIEQIMGKALRLDSYKAADEAIELGVVMAARMIIERIGGNDTASKEDVIFNELVQLYNRQPVLGVRTSTSVENQAYSTPVPIAFLAANLGDINESTSVYEPTAGQGALLITADASNTYANELDANRRASLEAQGFTNVTGNDATENVPGMKFDRVIANPPFGSVKDEKGNPTVFKTEKFETTAIDHVISLKALEAMKDDGKAVLIIGGKKVLGKDPDGEKRRAQYGSQKDRAFFKYLYDTYNVTKHFTIDGDLYARQGAQWPIDVIVIEGRGKSELRMPLAKAPEVFDSFEALKQEIVDERLGFTTQRDMGMGSPGRGRGDDGDTADEAGEDNADGGGMEGQTGGSGSGDGGRGGKSGGGGRGGSGGRGMGSTGSDTEDNRAGDADGDGAGGGTGGDREPADVASDDQSTGEQGRPDVPAGDDLGGLDKPPEQLSENDIGDMFDDLLEDEKPAPKGDAAPPKKAEPKPAPKPERDTNYYWYGQEPERDTNYYWYGGGYGPEERSLGEITQSIGKNLLGGADDAIAGLARLFGSGQGYLGSGPVFNEETYAKAKPMFSAALKKFGKAGDDIKALLAKLINELKTAYKFTNDQLRNLKQYVVRFMSEVQAGLIPGWGRSKSENTEKETKWQVQYEPKSRGKQVGTLIPVNMRSAVAAALNLLEKEVGNLDQYVAGKLGYTVSDMIGANDDEDGVFSAEQVDALAMAIYNHENGSGMIVGDQTGVGKGRIVAGMMRYALRNGMTPVFFTQNPKLYSDIIRDVGDIGIDDFRPVMTGTGAGHEVALEEDNETFKPLSDSANKKLMEKIRETGKLPPEYNVLFSVYSQLQTIKDKQEPLRRHALRALAPNSFIIMDESHEAGGTAESGWQVEGEAPNRSQFAREILADARGVLYSSATYAKNPSVMSLYFRTDMAKAVEKMENLAAVIDAGGVPMQGVIANLLVKVGQYLRRERSFDGVKFGNVTAEIDRVSYGDVSRLIQGVYALDRKMAAVRKAYVESRGGDTGEGGTNDNSKGDEGAEGTAFSSIMHNLIAQALLSMKAKIAVDQAIAMHKEGKKPILALSNTMGTFLSDYMDANGLSTGSKVGDDFKFNELIRRYLQKTREVSLTDPYDKKKKIRYFITDEDINGLEEDFSEVITEYYDNEGTIQGTDLGEMPVSPIDYMRLKMEEAGMRVGEITGRSNTMVTDEKTGDLVFGKRKSGAKQKSETVNAFNNDELDAIIMNRSGSTGWSGHASIKFKKSNHKTRHMIIVQPDANIDHFVQTLGRIHRTGQIRLPEYSLLVGDIPAEKRPAAILRMKMRSLNANTSANDDSAFTNQDSVDFLNRYGDRVVLAYLQEHREIAEMVGLDGKIDDEDAEGQPISRKFTGRLMLLEPEKQSDVLSEIISRYTDYIEELDRQGENSLVTTTTDLRAKTENVTIVKEGDGGPDDSFTGPVKMEQISAAILTKPYSIKTISEIIRDHLGLPDDARGSGVAEEGQYIYFGNEATKYQQSVLDRVRTAGAARGAVLRDELQKARTALEDAKNRQASEAKIKEFEATVKSREARLNTDRDAANQLYQALSNIKVGYSVLAKENVEDGAEYYGIVTGVIHDPKTNVLSQSGWKVRLAVADGIRYLQIPVSKLVASKSGWALDTVDRKEVFEKFRNRSTTGRERRYVITGNIVSGFEMFKKGKIVTFTNEDGTIREGILMPAKFDPNAEMAKKGVVFKTSDQAVQYMKAVAGKGYIEASDPAAPVTIQKPNKWGEDFLIKVKAKNGKAFYLNKQVRDIVGDFVLKKGKGAGYEATATSVDDVKKVIDIYTDVYQIKFQATVDKDIARQITGEKSFEEIQAEQKAKTNTRGAQMSMFGAKAAKPLYEKSRGAIRKRVMEIIDEMTGGRGQRKVVEMGQVPVDAEAARASGYTGDGPAVALGALDADNLIWVAMQQDAPATAYHESFHWLEKGGFFTKEELAALRADKKRLQRLAKAEGVDPSTISDSELRAYAFQAWSREVEEAKGQTGLLPATRRAFSKFKNLLQRILMFMRGKGFKTVDDVFDAAISGEAQKRDGGVFESEEFDPADDADRRNYEQKAGPMYRMGPSRPNRAQSNPLDDERLNLIRRKIGVDTLPFRQRIRNFIDEFKRNGLLRMKQGWLDTFAAVREYEEGKYGKLLDGAVSAYKALRMTQNVRGVMQAVLRYGAIKYVPQGEEGGYGFVIEQSPEFKGGFEGIFKDIATRGEMDLFKGWMVAKRANRLIAEERENLFTANEIDLLLNGHSDARRYRFERAFAKWQKFNGKLLDIAVQTGLLTQPQVDVMQEHGDYVPFYRIIDEQAQGPMLKRGAAGQSAGIRKLFGGDSRLGDPIENMVMNMTKIIDASFKNEAMQRVEKLMQDTGVLERVGMKPFKVVASAEELTNALNDVGIDAAALSAEERNQMASLWAVRPPEGRDIISIMEDGKRKYYRVRDPLLLRSLTQMNSEELSTIMKAFSGAKTLLTRMVTIDPAFMVSNAIRDTLHSYVVFNGPRITPFVDSWKGMSKTWKSDPSYRAILAAGGGVAGYYDASPESVNKELEKMFEGDDAKNILNTPKKLWDVWQKIGAASESGNRVAIFDRIREQGGTESEAAFQALDLMDYSMRGDYKAVRLLIETVPFLNARLQGLYRLWRGATEKGHAEQIGKINKQFLLHGAMIAGATLALAAMNMGEDWYEELEEWDKDSYYHFKIGGTHFRLPKPFEVGAIFSTIPERLTSLAFGSDTGEIAAKQMALMFYNTFSFTPIPQLLAPVFEAQMNRDTFTDRPIVPLGMDRLLPEEQFTEATSQLARILGRAIPTEISKPLEYAAGFNVKSPLVIDHLIGGYLGTIGMSIVQGTDAILGPLTGAPASSRVGIDTIPLVNRLYRRFFPDDQRRNSKYGTQFYDQREEIEKIVATIRELSRRGDNEGAQRLLAQELPKVQSRGELLGAYEVIGNINARLKQLRFDKTLTAQQKKEEADKLYKMRDEVYRRAAQFGPVTNRVLERVQNSNVAAYQLQKAAE